MVQSSVSNWFKKSPAILQNEWVDYDDISKQMVLAVITSEDQLFPDHWGFDLKQISETIEDFQKGKGLRGASTITQQLAKNLFLWNGRSFIRKGFEAYFTILLELFHSKRRIMELYLNIIELGPMVFGVKSASKTYFKKEPKNLTRYQSALIASVLPNPIRFKIDKPSDYLRNRQLGNCLWDESLRWFKLYKRDIIPPYMGIFSSHAYSDIQGMRIVSYIIILFLLSCETSNDDDFKIVPNNNWQLSSLKESNIDSLKIDSLKAICEAQPNNIVRSMLIVRHGKLVSESYFNGDYKDLKQDLRSAGKTVMGILFGIAVDKGYFPNEDGKLLSYFNYSSINFNDSRKQNITLKHLLSMTDGLDCTPCNDEMYNTADPVKYYLDRPMYSEPGTNWLYNEPNVYIIYQLIERNTGFSVEDWQNNFLYEPLNIKNTKDGLLNHIKPRDMAQIGQLFLNKGVWNGRRILSEDWINRSIQRTSHPSSSVDYGYYWWIRDFEQGDEQVISTYYAHGFGGQMIFVIPELDMVVVFTGNARLTTNYGGEKINYVRDYIIPAVLDK